MDFGKNSNKNFIQKAFKKFQKTGTTGSFTRWCKRHGYQNVNKACIKEGKQNRNLKIRRKAIFAQNIRSTSFGNAIKRDIRYLNSL